MSQVVIVGGGPVGLGLAIDLALRGVTSTVLERTQTLHQIPKGQNLTQRVGEHFRAWGVSDAVRTASPIPPEFGNAGIVCYEKLLGTYHYDWFQRSKVRDFYFAENERLPQYRLEQVLRDRADELPEITFLTGANVNGVSQNEESVEVSFQSPTGSETISAEYCVGCDGARSATRELAGIESDVDHEGPRMALLVFRSLELHTLLESFPGKSIFNVMHPDLDGYWQFLGRVDLNGGWFFHSPVDRGTTKENFDFHTFLHKFVGAEFELEFEHIGFWDLRITQAKSYRSGRIFIAGDACHSHPPYGGYGVNTGLEDACNLSWKLAAELHGWAGSALLDSYEDERHPVFKSVNEDFISRMIGDFREFTAKFDPEKDLNAFEAAWADRASGEDSEVTQFLPNYAGSPIVFGPEGTRSGAKGRHETTARAGFQLVPQPLPDGRDLWSELSNGFSLLELAGNSTRIDAFAQAADDFSVPLNVIDAPSRDLMKSYGCQAVLVRPDRFVAWVDDDVKEEPHAILSRAVGRSGV